MDTSQIDNFVDLVKTIKEENLLIPNMPKPIWYAIHSIVSLPAVEIIMTRTGRDFLLTNRDDEHFHGWSIPGGFIGYRESIEEACIRIAKREVNLIPKFKKVIDAHMWKDHPYSSALSVVCYCIVDGEPSDGQFFEQIPRLMVAHHAEFLRVFLDQKLSFTLS